MITLSGPSYPDPSHSSLDWRSAVVATAITGGGFAFVFASLTQSGGWAPPSQSSNDVSHAERIVYIAPRASAPLAAVSARMAPPRRTPAAAPTARIATTGPAGRAPHDTASAPTVTTARAEALTPGSIFHPLARLVPPRSTRDSVSWIPTAHDPFAAPVPPSRAARDSVLAAMRAAVPAMARARVPTQSERDATLRERMLKMHLAGRTLLAPPDGAGGGFGLPLFSPGPSRAERVRDSIAFAESRPRLERLRQRADSVERQRGRSPR